MKIRLLPQTDLVRAMPYGRADMKSLLRQVRFGSPSHSYNPTRACLGDLLNVRPGVFDAKPAAWSQIEHDISSRSRHSVERERNLAVARPIFDHVSQNSIVSSHQDLFPLKVGISTGVSLWNNSYYIEERIPWFTFFDLRVTRGLNAAGRKVAFSLMHERIRIPGSDFENAQLAIFRFPKVSEKLRKLRIYTAEAVDLYSYEELSQMIVQVHEVWAEVLAEREGDLRKAAGSEKGTLI